MLHVMGDRRYILIASDQPAATEPVGVRDRTALPQVVLDRVGVVGPLRLRVREVCGPVRDRSRDDLAAYVLAVPKSFPVVTAGGRRRADQLAAVVPAAGWQQVSCGEGAKGPRFYDWALIATASPAHHLLVRRPVGGGELAFFTCHAPAGTPLSQLVAVAGARWAIEECFQAGKNETGLDHYQVRRYDAWYRHVTLSMLGLAFLNVSAAQRGQRGLWTTFPDVGAAWQQHRAPRRCGADQPDGGRNPPPPYQLDPASPLG
jgi:hypothetical protein